MLRVRSRSQARGGLTSADENCCWICCLLEAQPHSKRSRFRGGPGFWLPVELSQRCLVGGIGQRQLDLLGVRLWSLRPMCRRLRYPNRLRLGNVWLGHATAWSRCQPISDAFWPSSDFHGVAHQTGIAAADELPIHRHERTALHYSPSSAGRRSLANQLGLEAALLVLLRSVHSLGALENGLGRLARHLDIVLGPDNNCRSHGHIAGRPDIGIANSCREYS